MVKTYSSTDNVFTGNNDFTQAINMSTKKIINVATPLDTNDLANKAYVDSTLGSSIVDSDMDSFSSSSSVSVNVSTISILVSAGEKVLLLAHGNTNAYSNGEAADIAFKRDTTGLNGARGVNLQNDDADSAQFAWSMQFLDTTPGTGTITYHVYGWTDDIILGDFTVIVMKA